MDKTVFCFSSGEGVDYYRALTEQRWACYPWLSSKDVPPDVVVFTGGPDVHPHLYGDTIHRASVFDITQNRDNMDKEAFHFAVENQIPMLGICRGAQFLTAMAGGSIIQHVENHTSNHVVQTSDRRRFNVNSTHHQMMYPYSAPFYEVLAWSEGLSTMYVTGGKLQTKIRYRGQGEKQVAVEPECVYYPHIQALAVQWHPERLATNSEGYTYFIEQIRKRLLA